MIGKSGTQRVFKRIVLLSALLSVWMISRPASAAESEEADAEVTYSRGSRICLVCHGEGKLKPAHEVLLGKMAVTADPATPLGEGNHECEGCHGPSKPHIRVKDGVRPSPAITFGADEPAEKKNSACLQCHDDGSRFHWRGGTHDFEETACVDCHDVHVANDPVLSLASQPAVCYDCHAEQRAQFLRQSRHPVGTGTDVFSHTGLMACSDCHAPHGSFSPGDLVRNTINETCYECHAEKRGPFLWEHAPVREDCSNCHAPHGSNYENLLTGRQPWLCQQCHSTAFHPSGAYSGTGIPLEGADPRILAGSCMSCHQQVHGTNHPSGIALTR